MQTINTVDEYIAALPEDVRVKLQTIRKELKKLLPEADEVIGYGIPTFKLNGKNIVHFAAFKNHIGFYPTPQGIIEFEEELSKYEQGKGSVQFPLDQPLPLDLMKRMTLFRLNKVQNDAKPKASKKEKIIKK